MKSDQDRQNKLGWCAKFKVELVSLNEELSTKDVANDEDEDDEFKEDPYERLREVVSTVSWRNASIHIHTPRMSFDASDELNVIKKCLNDRVVSDESPEAAPLASSVPGSAKTADNMEDDEDDDKNSFEKLFGKLHEMKGKN